MSCHHCQCGHEKTKPHGACEWLAERISSVALIPLTLWAVWSAVTLAGASYVDFTAWMAKPLNAGLLAALVIVGFWHGAMGAQTILDDYVPTKSLRCKLVVLVKLLATVLTIACLYSIYTIAF